MVRRPRHPRRRDCLVWLAYRSRENPAKQQASAGGAAGSSDRLRWIAYSFVPSSLLLGVTTHITTDLASAPLFWVVPLALYLLTFTLAFARRQPLPRPWMVRLQPLIVIPMIVLSLAPPNIWLLFLQLAGFFVIAMVCHGELAARRPAVQDLTQFYLCISLGGVLGGLFNAIIAPVIFPDVWEYPLMIAASCLIRPVGGSGGPNVARHYFLLPALVFLVLSLLLYVKNVPAIVVVGALVLTALVLLYLSERRWPFALGIAVCLLVVQLANLSGTLETTRSFFGMYRVRLVEDGVFRVLQHGTTIHGVESTWPGDEGVPLGYYSQNGPFGRFFKAAVARPLERVGVVGLGTGELIFYAQPGQVWVFHEIDPAVEQLARDERFFHFLTRSGERPRLVFGDARLTFQDVPNQFYDAIVIDAFSSDSIPVHLLTREALALYHRKLAAHGVILFHVSNRYLDLVPIITALAADAEASARHLHYRPAEPNKVEDAETEVIAVSQRGGDLGFLDADLGWEPPAPAPSSALWTDERSDIISRIKWR
jgi:SAM-dependent methyltransferase